jgi:hypothetical protein
LKASGTFRPLLLISALAPTRLLPDFFNRIGPSRTGAMSDLSPKFAV